MHLLQCAFGAAAFAARLLQTPLLPPHPTHNSPIPLICLLAHAQVSSFGEAPLLKPAVARLANAMVAVLGPDMQLGSAAYQRCKSLVTDLSGLLEGGEGRLEGLRGVEATWSELEQVRACSNRVLHGCMAGEGACLLRVPYWQLLRAAQCAPCPPVNQRPPHRKFGLQYPHRCCLRSNSFCLPPRLCRQPSTSHCCKPTWRRAALRCGEQPPPRFGERLAGAHAARCLPCLAFTRPICCHI